MTNTYYLFALLIAGIGLIIWLTAYKKISAFFALVVTALLIGIFSNMPLGDIVSILKKGFGDTMQKIGLLIILGTSLGVILEKTGATLSMANTIIKLVKERNAPIAIAITGFVVGFPIFCDSGFIILSGLNSSLVKKTNFAMPVMATVLATSMYAVHCLVPPHPGITAAIGTTGGDLATVMLWGLLLAIPTAFAGYHWCKWRAKRITYTNSVHEVAVAGPEELPPAGISFLPVLLPIALIALKSFWQLSHFPKTASIQVITAAISFTGDPVIALAIGILATFALVTKQNKNQLSHWLTEGVDKAGMILATIAAGGMFGEMLQATGMGKNLGEMFGGLSLGIFFPFLICTILKTAQGSSTVAIITTSSLVLPLIPSLGLQSPDGLTLIILSMGAGSMMISHANDAYFWVISKFSNLETSATLKIYSTATVIMGITAQLLIWIVSLMLK